MVQYVYVCLYVDKVSGVTVNCSPLHLIVQCITVWNVRKYILHLICAYIRTYVYIHVRMYIRTLLCTKYLEQWHI